jgi:hypothetical protein
MSGPHSTRRIVMEAVGWFAAAFALGFLTGRFAPF